MNEFESRWVAISESGHAAGRFRVYPDHLLNFYVQYSLAGLREIVIEIIADDLPAFALPVFRNIDLVKIPIAGGIRLGMTLLDGDLTRNFSVMCYDLAERASGARSVQAATDILLRALGGWAELFKKRGHEGLTREEVLGLVGELLMIETLLTESDINPDALIQGWRGPDGDARDIGVNGARIEVKAQRSTSSLRIRVSSINQLDDRGDRVFVVLMRLSPSEAGQSLVELMNVLLNRLEGRPLATLEFERKVVLSGISIDSELSHEKYSLDERLIYAVTDAFPRLIPSNVPLGITAVQYEVSGQPLDGCRTTWEQLLRAING